MQPEGLWNFGEDPEGSFSEKCTPGDSRPSGCVDYFQGTHVRSFAFQIIVCRGVQPQHFSGGGGLRKITPS